MKEWFPFSNYDFYAYLTSGMIIIAAYDEVFMNSILAQQEEWTIASGVFWIAIAYLLGQIVAIPSSALLEHFLARGVLHSPASILLGTVAPRWREKAVSLIFGAREYQPFPIPNRENIINKIANCLRIDRSLVTSESAFQCAYPYARSVEDTAIRLDNFLNQYGMCRNVSFASGVAAILLAFKAYNFPSEMSISLLIGAIILFIGLFGRFIKFYAAYAREVFRAFDKMILNS